MSTPGDSPRMRRICFDGKISFKDESFVCRLFGGESTCKLPICHRSSTSSRAHKKIPRLVHSQVHSFLWWSGLSELILTESRLLSHQSHTACNHRLFFCTRLNQVLAGLTLIIASRVYVHTTHRVITTYLYSKLSR